jgi:hypothetical protein
VNEPTAEWKRRVWPGFILATVSVIALSALTIYLLSNDHEAAGFASLLAIGAVIGIYARWARAIPGGPL